MCGTITPEREARRVSLWRAAFRVAPTRVFSTTVGLLSRTPIPIGARERFLRAYAVWTGINLEEAELPLSEYRTLDELFTRRLKPGLRPIDDDPATAVSPVDAEVLEFGSIGQASVLDVKGQCLSVAGLLADGARAERYLGGRYVTLYLSPKDYHRIHAPVSGHVVECRHIPGELMPVNPALGADRECWCKNERLITFIEGHFGEVAVVKVAACGVGHVTATYDPTIHTHAWQPMGRRIYDPPHEVSKGDEIGVFHLGSTVVVLFQPGSLELLPLTVGQRILMGQAIARRVDRASQGPTN